jgi:hypothetical protein
MEEGCEAVGQEFCSWYLKRSASVQFIVGKQQRLELFIRRLVSGVACEERGAVWIQSST